MAKEEKILQERIANYLVQNYPDVLFHSDYGSGAKLSKTQAAKQKRLNGRRKSWPDMFIAKMGTIWRWEESPTGVFDHGELINLGGKLLGAHGLFLELKKGGEKLYPGPRSHPCNRFKSKDGEEYRTEHLRDQADVLYGLRQNKYCAEFAIGYDHAISIITDYLGEPKKQEVEF